MKRFVVILGGNLTVAGIGDDAVVNADLVIDTPASDDGSARKDGLAKRNVPGG